VFEGDIRRSLWLDRLALSRTRVLANDLDRCSGRDPGSEDGWESGNVLIGSRLKHFRFYHSVDTPGIGCFFWQTTVVLPAKRQESVTENRHKVLLGHIWYKRRLS